MKKIYSLYLAINFIISILAQQPEFDLQLLACAAVSKKIYEVEDELNNFRQAIQLFSSRINHNEEQTRNFVNLLILNNCMKSITPDVANAIIQQKGKTGLLDASYLALLRIKTTFSEYSELDNDAKKTLFDELAGIKEGLKKISDLLGKMNGMDEMNPGNRQAQAQRPSSNQDSESINIFDFLSNAYNGIVMIVLDNPLIIIGLLISLLIPLLGSIRIRRKKIKAKDN